MNCEYEVIDWNCDFNPERTPFWAGIPFVGFQSKVLRRARRILGHRNIENALDGWLEAGYCAYKATVFCDRVFRLTREWARWPNYYFAPYDNARIILCNIPGLDAELSDVIIPLFRMYGVAIDWERQEGTQGRILNGICCGGGMRMGDLLSFLLGQCLTTRIPCPINNKIEFKN